MEDTLKIMGSNLPNIEKKAKIFYGIISRYSIMPEALSDILSGHNTIYTGYKETIEKMHRNMDKIIKEGDAELLYEITKNIFGVSDWNRSNNQDIFGIHYNLARSIFINFYERKYDEIREIFEEVINKNLEFSGEFLWTDGGYKIIDYLDTDLMIIVSPYYCFAPEYSPCVPCAGNLDSISEGREYSKKTYCLGLDFYEDEDKPKYKIYQVEDDKSIN